MVMPLENLLATESQLTYFPLTVNELISNDSLPEECLKTPLCPLSHITPGSAVRIKQVSASPEITSRLREMGFCEEQQIRLISRHSNVICQVCHARLGISTQLADKILVEPIHGRKAA